MKVNLKELRGLPGQKLDLQFQESIDSENEILKPVLGNISLSATTISVKLYGQIQTTLKLQCHTCLNPFLQSLALELDEEFVYEDYLNGEALSLKERELQKQDFFETVPYYGAIDVSDVVSQAIILAIPTYCSCGPNCAGPPIYKRSANGDTDKKDCPPSNTNQPIDQAWTDPRWHNLKTILLNSPKQNKVRDNSSS